MRCRTRFRIRLGEEFLRRVRQGGLGWGQRGCRQRGERYAGRFPGIDHQLSRQNCLSYFEFYVAADSGEIFGYGAKRDAMKGFLKWALTDGQSYAENLSYAKLPKEVVAKELKAIDKIQ